jgi:SAM-dependent methyltransferase
MHSPDSGFDQLKDRMRKTWMTGDFGQVAQYAVKGAEEFVDRLHVVPGMQVLDVACGTGNVAIPAARKGAQVIGVDIAANLLEQARQRAAAEGLTIRFEEGDAEQLAFPDASFDIVTSMFGAMFAPRPDHVARELMRVCRPGGVVAMANWTPQGFVGKVFDLTRRYAPGPEGVPPPILWGDETIVRDRLGERASRIDTARREVTFDYPYPPREVVQFFRTYFGPTHTAFARLDEAGQAALASDLENLWQQNNQGKDGRTVTQNEYLEVLATRS